MTSKLVMTLATFAILMPLSAHAQEQKFSNERESVSESRYVTEWKAPRGQARKFAEPVGQSNQARFNPASPTSPVALNATTPASGGNSEKAMFGGKGITHAQEIPVSPYNQ